MKPDTALNSGIGIGGTALAFITQDGVALAAGLATFAWMLWQLGCSIYDRAKGRKRGPVDFPPDK